MLHSRMNNIFFGCSPQVLSNKKLQMNIEKVSIDFLLPESGAPHMNIEEVGGLLKLLSSLMSWILFLVSTRLEYTSTFCYSSVSGYFTFISITYSKNSRQTGEQCDIFLST